MAMREVFAIGVYLTLVSPLGAVALGLIVSMFVSTAAGIWAGIALLCVQGGVRIVQYWPTESEQAKTIRRWEYERSRQQEEDQKRYREKMAKAELQWKLRDQELRMAAAKAKKHDGPRRFNFLWKETLSKNE